MAQSPGSATLLSVLGTPLPLIQAPMAGVQGSALAIAVCRAGGLGSLPCAMLASEAIIAEITAIRVATDAPFNANFFCHVRREPSEAESARWADALASYAAEFGPPPKSSPKGASRRPFDAAVADLLEPLAPPVVSFHFGLPAPDLLARVRSWGSRILASATTVAEARWLAERGVDAIIAQGVEAGGHRGSFLSEEITTQVGTFALVPQVVDAVGVPVIAAGGIADARGVRAALALGAAGVQVGTAFLLCPEATTAPAHRAAIRDSAPEETALTNLYSGRPARGIVTRLMRDLGPMGEAPPPFPHASTMLAPLRAAAEARGSTDFTPLWRGQNRGAFDGIPAGEVIRALSEGLS
ncbi:MAG: nitronate monooxygenase [Rhodospirillum sp.]|nr:nitronate monooxygenase [Rhodospirillum sp.]MCF8487549.1 nitronate monooxygenase [Rhodospirillum sp.]MCF8499032.1 nitronate monooxygenase [Rhodospirillum sp.]